LIDIFKDGESFDAAITPLIDASFVRRQHSGSTSKIEILQTIQQFVQWNMTPTEKLDWTKHAIRIVSHALPEEPSQDARFESVRSRLTPHVFRCVDNSKRFTVDQLVDVIPQLVSMLLASIARAGMELDYVDALVRSWNDGYYRCLAAKWRGY